MRLVPLCLGTMTFGTEFGMGADREKSQKIFDAYADSPRKGYANGGVNRRRIHRLLINPDINLE
jgi:hypothetical protein